MDKTVDLQIENQHRLGELYKRHHKWLIGSAYNYCKNQQIAEDLVGDLYVYLGEEPRQKLWARESFNILYCISFLKSRWINKVNRDKKINYKSDISDDRIDEKYDEEWDNRLEKTYNDIIKEINEAKKTGMWVSAKLMEMYWIEFPEETLEGIANKVNISNSTVFLHIKKMKSHLKNKLNNPFK